MGRCGCSGLDQDSRACQWNIDDDAERPFSCYFLCTWEGVDQVGCHFMFPSRSGLSTTSTNDSWNSTTVVSWTLGPLLVSFRPH